MGSITAADAVVVLQVTGISLAPTQIQGFGTDDVFDVPAIQSAETMMGVDGILSAGFVFVEIPWNFTLQADSLSNLFFDTWWTQMQASKATFSASGTIIVPATSTKYNLVNGFLKSYKPAPDAKKVLQARKFGITWNSILPAPTGA
jgi:hypothetical protein